MTLIDNHTYNKSIIPKMQQSLTFFNNILNYHFINSVYHLRYLSVVITCTIITGSLCLLILIDSCNGILR